MFWWFDGSRFGVWVVLVLTHFLPILLSFGFWPFVLKVFNIFELWVLFCQCWLGTKKVRTHRCADVRILVRTQGCSFQASQPKECLPMFGHLG